MKYWREIWAVAQRIILELWRRQRSLLFWAVFPISLLLLNGSIFAQREDLSSSEAIELAAASTIVGAALFFSCLGGTVATVVAEREQNTIKRLFISPLSGTSYFLGIFLAHSFIGIGQTILVYTIAVFLGANFEGSIPLGILIIVLTILAYVGLGFLLGTQLGKRTEDVNTLVATFGIPLLILGGVFLPASLFPDSLIEVARFNPIYHMNEAMISVWAQGEGWTEIRTHLLFLVCFAGVTFFTGWLAYRRMLHMEKRL